MHAGHTTQAVPGYISDQCTRDTTQGIHRLFLVIFLINARGTQHKGHNIKGPQAVPGYINSDHFCARGTLVIFLTVHAGHNTRVHRLFLVIFLINTRGTQYKDPQAVPGYISDQCTRDTTQGSTGCSWLYF